MEGKELLQDASKDNLNERLGSIAVMFIACHALTESVTRLEVLEDMFNGNTSEFLHDIACMLVEFDKEIERMQNGTGNLSQE